MVANLEEKERNGDNNDDSPETDELRGKDRGVAICQDGEIVALNITEGQDDVCQAISYIPISFAVTTPTFPPILPDHFRPFLEPVFVESIPSIHYIKQHIVEQSLEGRDGCALNDQKCGQSIGAGDTNREDLAKNEDEPKIFGE